MSERKPIKSTAMKSGIEKHHTIPVGMSIEHIDWHLRHLWDDGWKTIREVSVKEHKEIHHESKRPHQEAKTRTR